MLSIAPPKPLNVEYKTILKEFNLFEANGKLTKNLKMLLNGLLCIKLTSVESKKVFSTVRLFVMSNQRPFRFEICLFNQFIRRILS